MSAPRRHPMAIALDAWLADPKTKTELDGSASGEYLRKRLVRAFQAGWDAADKAWADAFKKNMEGR